MPDQEDSDSLSDSHAHCHAWLDEYIEVSTVNDWLHGFQFPPPKHTRLFQGVWVGIIVVCLGFSVYLCLLATWDYNEHLMTSDIVDSVYSEELVLFPAVTLCSANRGQRSFFKRLGFKMNPKDWLQKPEDGSRSLQTLKDMIYTGRDGPFTHEELVYMDHVLENSTLMAVGRDMELMRALGLEMGEKKRELAAQHLHHRRRAIFMMGSQQEKGFPSLLDMSFQGNPLPQRPDLRHALYQTSQGFCTHVRPHVFWNPKFQHTSFDELIRDHDELNTSHIGDTSGISVLIDAEVWDYAYSMEKAAGFKLYIHHFQDHPPLHLEKLLLRPGHKYHVGLSPQLVHTTQSSIERFEPQYRKCYTEDEFGFNWLSEDEFRYSSSNCLNEALFDRVFEQCNCSTGPDGSGCFGQEITCRDRILDEVGFIKFAQNRKFANRSQLCLPSCFDETFQVKLAGQFTFPEFNSFLFEPDIMCRMFNRLQKLCNHPFKRESLSDIYPDLCAEIANSSLNICDQLGTLSHREVLERIASAQGGNLSRSLFVYARENLIQVKIYFDTLHVNKLIRSEKQPMIWFVANLAGLIGLVVGSSLLMACQVFTYIFLWCGVKCNDFKVHCFKKQRRHLP